MSEERPKVVSLRSRKPYEAPAPVPVDPNGIDRGSILVLEELTKRFEDGELSGCIVMAWNKEHRRFENIIAIPAEEHLSEASLKYAGGLLLMNEDVLSMHFEAEGDDYEEYDEEDA